MRRSALSVAGLALAIHLLWTGALFLHGYEVRDFIGLGRDYVARGDQSGPIHVDPGYHYVPNGIGYDGQWAYYIAVDPGGAAPHIDGPSYRYGRILYPLAGRLLALGQAELVPLALIAVNLLAVALGTLALGTWLKRRGWSSRWALLFAFNPGMVIALHRDLTEPLAYALVAGAVVLTDPPTNFPPVGGRTVLSGLLFALAVLARETTAVFLLVFAGAMAWRRRSYAVLALALLPFIAWELYLRAWLGPLDTGQAAQFEVIPFGGLLRAFPLQPAQAARLALTVVPSTLLAVAAVIAVVRGGRDVALWALLANYLLFVVFLPRQSYVDAIAAPRVAIAVVLAALLALPAIAARLKAVPWYAASAALWVLPLPLTVALNLLDRPSGLIRV